MERYTLPQFLELPREQQLPIIDDRAILYAQQFNRAQLDHYCKLADACRTIHKSDAGADLLASLLRRRTALNFFVQPSSRTFLSFSAAQSILGMRRMSLRDLNISSMSKGESLVDSIRTFMSYVDLIVMRHKDESAALAAFWISWNSDRRLMVGGEERILPIVSGGAGSKEHPTQALLDVYTLERSFEDQGGIEGKTIMMVGDLKRGRTVRSLAFLMRNYPGVRLIFAAPERYQMSEDVCEFLIQHKIPYSTVDSMDDGIETADAIYMTRIQDEWDELAGEGHVASPPGFRFELRHLDRMKRSACLLHPLPKRDEVDEAVDYAGDKRVVYWRQERNGMWMRVAIIATLFKVDSQILAHAFEHH